MSKRLLVNGIPLHESPMKDHPLTPMRDSCLIRMLEAQSVNKAGPIQLETVRMGSEAVSSGLRNFKARDAATGSPTRSTKRIC